MGLGRMNCFQGKQAQFWGNAGTHMHLV